MTLLQVAEKLHVDPKVTECIEDENFEPLGATVYAKGHLKRYAELVGEDAQQILDQFTSITKPVLPDLTQVPKAQRPADPGKLVVPSLVVLIGLVLVGVVWWILQGVQKGTIGAPAVPRTVESTPLPEPEESPTPAPTGAGTPSAPPTVAANRPSDARTSSGGAGGASRAAPASVGSGTTTAPVAQAAPAEPPHLRTIDLTLKFAADSWVEVYDANGERLFYDIGSASSSRKVSGTPPLRVVLGNAPSVTLDVNGKRARVPANVVTEDSAQFLINSSGRIVRARPPGDGG